MPDLLTIEYARNAILAFSLSGMVLAYVSGGMHKNERLPAGLFVGQIGALGLVAGSVTGLMLPVVTAAAALAGVVVVLLISRFLFSGKTDTSRRVFFQIGFFLAASVSVVIVSKTSFARPRVEELMFGRMFTVSVQEIMVLLGVAISVFAATIVLRRLWPNTHSVPILLALCAGPIIPLLGVIPFAALFVLLPEVQNQAHSSPVKEMLAAVAHVVIAAIAGVYFSLKYGLAGAPTVTVGLALIASLRYVVSRKSRVESR